MTPQTAWKGTATGRNPRHTTATAVILSTSQSAQPKGACLSAGAPQNPTGGTSRPPGGASRGWTALLAILFALLTTLPAHAHIGSKDVFEQISSGPYKFFVTIRPPTVVPGVATVEVRIAGPAVASLSITPVPLTGEASLHPPTPDAMKVSAVDPAFFTGSLWLMSSGSWQVRLQATGAGGPATASVPVPAVALSVLKMQRPMGFALAALGLILVFGMAGIFYGAVREARLAPGVAPDAHRTRRATLAAGLTLAVLALMVWGGDKWWNVEAADYSADLFHPLALHPVLNGDVLDLHISRGTPDEDGERRSNSDLLPDHGQLMHLYVIRWPQMDAVYHLHPHSLGNGDLRSTLPAMPAGTYHLFGDIVHRSGFPETLTATLVVPPNASRGPLDSQDASAAPPPLSAGDLGTSYRLPDGYIMAWDRPAALTAGTAELFRFRLLDPAGHPAAGMQPYLGMAGHAAFVKTDGTVFAHTHPDGSAAMPALMLANPDSMSDMAAAAPATPTGEATARSAQPLAPTVEFPYGFPTPGRYRIFIQMKHADTVETGVFDAEVK